MDGIANCHTLATCTNKEKGYDCTCKTGFIGDGTTECKDIDECLQGEDDCLGRDHLFFPIYFTNTILLDENILTPRRLICRARQLGMFSVFQGHVSDVIQKR